MARFFDFSSEQPPAPDVYLTLLDEAGKRCVGSTMLVPEPRVGDRVRGRVITELQHYANGVCAPSRPVER